MAGGLPTGITSDNVSWAIDQVDNHQRSIASCAHELGVKPSQLYARVWYARHASKRPPQTKRRRLIPYAGKQKGHRWPKPQPQVETQSAYDVHDNVPAAFYDPIYDPHRDGPPVWESLTARVFGDPPLGRRALDTRLK